MEAADRRSMSSASTSSAAHASSACGGGRVGAQVHTDTARGVGACGEGACGRGGGRGGGRAFVLPAGTRATRGCAGAWAKRTQLGRRVYVSTHVCVCVCIVPARSPGSAPASPAASPQSPALVTTPHPRTAHAHAHAHIHTRMMLTLRSRPGEAVAAPCGVGPRSCGACGTDLRRVAVLLVVAAAAVAIGARAVAAVVPAKAIKNKHSN